MAEPQKRPAPGVDREAGQRRSNETPVDYHPAVDLLQRLEAVRPAGRDQWIARCPAHDDRRPSLSLRWLENRWLLHDFGGCEPGEILEALGLTFPDLFDGPTPHRRGPIPIESRWDWRGLLQQLDVDAGTVAMTAQAAAEGCLDESAWERFQRARDRIGRVAALAREGGK